MGRHTRRDAAGREVIGGDRGGIPKHSLALSDDYPTERLPVFAALMTTWFSYDPPEVAEPDTEPLTIPQSTASPDDTQPLVPTRPTEGPDLPSLGLLQRVLEGLQRLR